MYFVQFSFYIQTKSTIFKKQFTLVHFFFWFLKCRFNFFCEAYNFLFIFVDMQSWLFYLDNMSLTFFGLDEIFFNFFLLLIMLGKGQNYENQNVENQKELRKLRRRSERRNGLFSWSERRKGKRSEHRKECQN